MDHAHPWLLPLAIAFPALLPSPDHRFLDEAPTLRLLSLRFRDPETERAFQAAARFLLSRVGEPASIDVLEVR